MTRVLIADDHDVVRQGIRLILDNHDEFTVVGEAASIAELLSLLTSVEVDLVLLDLRLPDGNGISAISSIRATAPTAAIVILSAYGSAENLRKAQEAGAAGFLVKNADVTSIRDGIRAALQGKSLTPAPKQPTGCPDPEDIMLEHGLCLSRREREVLELMGSGRQNKEIADALHLAEKSVRNIVTRLFRKLGVSNRTEAAIWMRRLQDSLSFDDSD